MYIIHRIVCKHVCSPKNSTSGRDLRHIAVKRQRRVQSGDFHDQLHPDDKDRNDTETLIMLVMMIMTTRIVVSIMFQLLDELPRQ